MDDVLTFFLRTPLFSTGATDPRIPPRATIVRGVIASSEHGLVWVKAKAFLDDAGKVLAERDVTLVLPMSKIDHAIAG
jgi:hypothetical protein